VSERAARVIELLARLPGVGEKTAQRYLLHLLTSEEKLSRDLGAELAVLRDHVKSCVKCGNIAEVEAPSQTPICPVCSDNKRDGALLCVVARVHDLLAIERAGSMRGRYFVLGKLLSPLEGVGPDDLPLRKLIERVKDGVKEVILATPPSVDGEATALLIKRELEPLGLSLSRIASGVPHGGDLEFADPITMGRALSGRQRM
jgi:recombination protein RecR